MGVGWKYDYEPLLAPGRHAMTLDQIEALVVKRFPGNRRRLTLFQRLEQFVQDVLRLEIPCEVWLDGSLLTQKADPDDLDVSVIVDKEVVDALCTEHYATVKMITEQREDGVDAFLFVRYPMHDPLYKNELMDPGHYWGECYGLEHSKQWCKGYVVMRLRETHVGLRICS